MYKFKWFDSPNAAQVLSCASEALNTIMSFQSIQSHASLVLEIKLLLMYLTYPVSFGRWIPIRCDTTKRRFGLRS